MERKHRYSESEVLYLPGIAEAFPKESEDGQVVNGVVSDATRKNWNRLNIRGEAQRLTRRANKRLSSRKIVPIEYFKNSKNQALVLEILSFLDDSSYTIVDLLCSVAEILFSRKGIGDKDNVRAVLSEYSYRKILALSDALIPQDETDILGIIYQSSLLEGEKNRGGMYYTPFNVISSMVKSLVFTGGETFLDPCCGSGAFLISVPCDNPNQLYGVDNDSIAVMIAKFNLLLRYSNKDFLPNIVCDDFLQNNPFPNQRFDYVVTNPPWGAITGELQGLENISSRETFSLFFVKSFKQAKGNGIIRFLLPESILNVKVHKDVRAFILDNCNLSSISVYDGLFSGVLTGVVDIECRKGTTSENVFVNKGGASFTVDASVFAENENKVFSILTPKEMEIVRQCKRHGKYTLEKSAWALGIVTGGNKEKLHSNFASNLEAVYTGKEIVPYRLKLPQNFILYDRESFQQVAKEEYYRAPEKLVYKFISSKLVFAYDDKQRLFLNSANILIPRIPNLRIKTVMALLNSDLFSFLYQKMFGEVKILKGNLLQLPFPEISKEQDSRISDLVDCIMSGDMEDIAVLQQEVYSLFHLSQAQVEHIKVSINGNTNKRVKRVNSITP